MSDSVLDRFVRPSVKPAEAAAPAPAEEPTEEPDDYGSFGWLRGARERAIMLELRKKDGSIRAFGYAWLQEICFDPSDGITLCLPAGKIRLIGRNLNAEIRENVRLFQGIARHRVPFVQEIDELQWMRLAEGDIVIERIEW